MVDYPKTIFSFKVLGNFHLHTLTSKKTAYHYCDATQRKMNPILPHHKKEITEARPEERHKYMRFFAIDGCHSAQHLKKRDDPDDIALNAGAAYFGPRAAFQEYASKQTEEPDPLHCSKLRAARMQNILKFKNTIITGIVGMICTWHGFFYPGGIVDMDRGEGYHLADWIIWHAFQMYPWLHWIFGSYNLWCIWIKNFMKRLENNSEFFKDEDLRELHKDKCKMKFHYAYTKFIGMTVGKLIKTPWAMEKLTAGSTMHMNNGHRHDILDDFHNWWNFSKLQLLGHSLKLKCSKAHYAILKLEPAFKELTDSLDQKMIEEWDSLYAKLLPGPWDKNGEDLFISRNNKRIPTFKSHIDGELTLEHARVNNDQAMDGLADLVVQGINLDIRHVKLAHLVSLKNPPADKVKKLALARAKLLKDMVAFGDLLTSYRPSLVTLIQSQVKDINTQRPEQLSLPLPSSFALDAIKAARLEDAVAMERNLCEGQAHDCLEDIRCHILTYNHITAVKKVEVTGQKQHTRGLAMQRTQVNGAQDAMRLYNHNRQCMLSLGMEEKDPVFQEVKETELWRQKGESEEEEQKWILESQRAKWFHDWAALDRWKEEKEILEVEYPRVVRAHMRMEEIWKTIATEYKTLVEVELLTDQECAIVSGHVAYARKQACMYMMLKEDVEAQWVLQEKMKQRKTKWDRLNEASAIEENEEGEEWEDTDNFSYLDEEAVVEED
ncbi:hypothetical protein PQX77_007982 [Marasmius sp. AFHP31]|nr:hypothetical protein PQX77_007982 [Marasmius sp. AFHP31]